MNKDILMIQLSHQIDAIIYALHQAVFIYHFKQWKPHTFTYEQKDRANE